MDKGMNENEIDESAPLFSTRGYTPDDNRWVSLDGFNPEAVPGASRALELQSSVRESEHQSQQRVKEMEQQERAQRIAAQQQPHEDDPLFLDIETIPDFDREHLFAGRPEDVQPRTPVEECPGEEVLNGTVQQVEQALSAIRPSDQWITKLLMLEGEKEKPTAGKIAALRALRRRLDAEDGQHADWLKKMATTPEYCRIVAMGWAVGNGPVYSIVVGTDGDTEFDILNSFWQTMALHRPVIGYNLRTFDIPVLLCRSAILGVESTFAIDRRKFGSKDILDLYEARYDGTMGDSSPGAKSLKYVAKILGIEIPAGDIDGSQVLDIYRENPEKIHEYVQSDVIVTRKYHKLMQSKFW